MESPSIGSTDFHVFFKKVFVTIIKFQLNEIVWSLSYVIRTICIKHLCNHFIHVKFMAQWDCCVNCEMTMAHRDLTRIYMVMISSKLLQNHTWGKEIRSGYNLGRRNNRVPRPSTLVHRLWNVVSAHLIALVQIFSKLI